MNMDDKRDIEKKAGMTGLFSKAGDFVRGGTGRAVIVGAGILGILLIGLSGFLPKGSQSQNGDEAKARQTAEEFTEKTEQKIATIVRSIEGAGECQVMVTLENGVEYVYASQNKINTDRQEDDGRISQRDDSEQSIIVVDTDEGRQGLLVTEIQPTVKGVVVVCRGGDQPLVQQRIIDTVTTALNISSKRVCVTKLSE